jgi:DNA polymerase
MDRREAVLRELNLYPLWVVREQETVPSAARCLPLERGKDGMGVETERQESKISTPSPTLPDVTTSQLTRPAKDAGQVIGYLQGGRDGLQWPELKQTVRDCQLCALRAGCKQTVFGVGDEQADWLFVGEGPGADEDERGEPFVGQAGKLLDNMLAAIKLRRGNNVYIGNIVKCRPPGNRAPLPEEVASCMPYLQRQIELIQPKLIVALGKTAANALLNNQAALGSLRGTVHRYNEIPLIVTYHPAYLLRSPAEKAKAWQDLCMAVDTMQKQG